ncbi:cell wall-binding repeat-containing protein [Ornithinimicrobium faecis]|uniref:Cell wall-binding repeat-containing protein n=1 Tax=Ornithinimicrobium faecis TaxID=2934158 RepID=A0ABY4YY80_9MICO|nr:MULTISPECIES: cell wall-binding repeat-containing protein [unclassified Ornithinimicrobium]USQ81744.1 cell wall-binding repeat-containing protein [Ornithinimicrobium sp. HY1793]
MKTFRSLATGVVAMVLVLACSLAQGSAAGSPTADPAADHSPGETSPSAGDLGFSVERLAGSDRYATAAAISGEFFAPGVPVAVVATGANFPDGLSAGPAADELGGPVLFVTRDSVPAVTRTELLRLRPQQIVVVGGLDVISSPVRSQLDGLTDGTATRLAGTSRYDTAAAVSAHAFPGGADIAYLATGTAFPDALAGGAAAGIQDAPMLLTQRNHLSSATRVELERLNPDRIMLLGGTSAISGAVAAQLEDLAIVERVSGQNRYATALAVSQRVFGTDRPGVLLATGKGWPDALSASAAVRHMRGPILLTTGATLPDGTRTELSRLSPDTAYVLGGRSAQTNEIPREVQRRLGVCWSGTRPSAGDQEVITSVPGATKQIAYTLDMGGRLTGADEILDFLIEHQVCTTFFPTSIMANSPEGRPIMARIAAHPELFEIGNHTVHHCDLVNGGGGSPSAAPCQVAMTRSFVQHELTDAEPVLESLAGMQANPYWRPPFGSHNSTVRGWLADVGYTKTVMWSRDTIDWDPDTTAAQIISRTTLPAPPAGTIVLSHLGGYATPDALPVIVSSLRAQGYTFTTLSDMRD